MCVAHLPVTLFTMMSRRDYFMTEQETNVAFVREVEKHPELYNYEMPAYSRKDTVDQAWESVGNVMNMTPSACKEKWRNLRAVFVRNYKAPSIGIKKKPYYLAEEMQFVVPFLKPTVTAEHTRVRKTIENRPIEIEDEEPFGLEIGEIKQERDMDENSDHEWCSHNCEDSRGSSKRQMQDTEVCHNPTKKQLTATTSTSASIVGSNDHYVKSFLDSLVPELTEMTSTQFKNFKRRVFVLIDEIVSE